MNATSDYIIFMAKILFKNLSELDTDTLIETLNSIRKELHSYSPFKDEPVDCIQWVKSNRVQANEYNPNVVAPVEMKLLKTSIDEDGYTQPIVSWQTNNHYEVVDGFHRSRIGKEYKDIEKRLQGYLPLVVINNTRSELGDRMASTIRHNRARGKHTVEGMSDIVVELKKRNWSDEKIAKSLGMEQDEILRLCQITGLAELFTDQDFSKSWELEDSEPNFIPLDDDFEYTENDNFRNVNRNGEQRIFHTFDKWECQKAGFYNTTFDGLNRQECEQVYKDFLSNDELFIDALSHVITEWKNSCEHYLTNETMNRIAWLGQAAICYATGIPSTYQSGFQLLSQEQQYRANMIALEYLNKWLITNNRKTVSLEQGLSDKQVDLY